jgi:hypothetical protein
MIFLVLRKAPFSLDTALVSLQSLAIPLPSTSGFRPHYLFKGLYLFHKITEILRNILPKHKWLFHLDIFSEDPLLAMDVREW